MTAVAGTAAAQTPRLDVFDENVMEGGAITFKVLLSAESSQPVTVQYATASGADRQWEAVNAQSGSDFTAASGTLTFAPGETRKSVRVSTTEDSIYEWDERFEMRLSSPTNARLGDAKATGRIDNDDAPPTVSISDGSATEGEAIEFEVSLSAPSERQVSVTLKPEVGPGDTAKVLDDFDDSEWGLGMACTVSPCSVTVRVVTTDDDIDENDETFTVRLSNPGNARLGDATATGTIVDDDDGTPPPPGALPTVGFLVDSNVAEGGRMRFWVKLSKRSDRKVSVQYKTSSGTAQSGTDFTPASGLLVFSPGNTLEEVYVGTMRDRFGKVDEGNETFTLTLSSPIRATLGDSTATGTITEADTDVDGSPYVAVAASTNAVEGKPVTFTVRLSAPGNKQATVRYETRKRAFATIYVNGEKAGAGRCDYMAKSGVDYVATSGTLTFAPQETEKTVSVSTIDDNEHECTESLDLDLSNPTNAVIRTIRSGKDDKFVDADILDNDDAPVASFALQASSAQEDSGTHDITVNLSPAPTWAITLNYAEGGTASPGKDYGLLRRTVSVLSGATTATIPVKILDDSVEDDGETVVLKLTAGNGYAVGTIGTHTLTIQNHEPAVPSVTVARKAGTASSITEGGDAAFTLTATPVPTADLAVSVTVATDGAWGVTAGTRTVTIPTTGSATLTLPTIGDEADEPDGSVTVTVTDGAGYTVGSPASDTVAIGDDDLPPPVVTIAAGASVTEGGDAVFTLTANPAPAADLAVTVTIGTDGDFGIAAGERTVTIPTAGSATLTLATTGDSADEPDGSVIVTVKDGDGYTVGAAASDSVTVRDDDDTTPDWTDYQTVVSYLVEVRDNPKNTAVKGNPVHIAKWNRVLEAVGHDTGTGVAPMAASVIHANAAQWPDSPFKAASVYLKSQEQQQEPAVTVSAGTSAVTEGGDAVFTLTASPPPAADLPVTVTVATDGDWGVSAGTQTVTIPTTGSATLTLATTDDAADEPDGSVSVTVKDGDGYTVGSPASGSVTVRDDDEPPPDTPAVTLSAGSAVTEGGSATFTLTASPAPAADLAVSVTVAATGAYGIAAGPQTVTIPTTGIATLTLATTDDTTNEPDGSVTVTVTDGSGYTVGDPASGTVAIRDDDVPVVTVSAGSAVTEGGSATFTLTANPVPAAPLAVSVTVATDGDYGVTAGKRTVTLPTTGSTTLTLTTTDDAADEPDGSVTVTVEDGGGYTVGTPASGTVALRDDDLPPPVVTIAAKAASVAEGGDAVFTLTADRAPASDLSVTLSVSETGAGDHVAASDEGPATVTIPKDATEATFSVATVNDATDEPDSSASVAVQPGAGYTVGAPASASVEVTDDDAPSAAPALSVGDSTAKEGARFPVMPFTVRLSPPAPAPVRVHVSTRPSAPVSAEPGRDYAPGSSALTFRAGETEKQVWILIYDDSHDEGAETFEVVLSQAEGATIGDGVAVGTIVNDDPMPAAWLARFARTVAEQALDGIAGRMSAPRTPGMQGTLAGQAVSFDPAASGTPAAGGVPSAAGTPEGSAALAMADIARGFGGHSGHDPAGFGNGPGFMSPGSMSGTGGAVGIGFGQTPPHSRTMTARDALLGSSFSLTGQPDGSGGSMAFWGRASQGSFDGREGTFSLDGEATTALLGADYARGKWLIGLALAQSDGEGDYRDTGIAARAASQDCPAEAEDLCRGAVWEGDGKVEASLTAAVPYAALRVSERLKLWGAAGYGSGEVTLKTELGGRYKADTTWRMAATGMRGDLLEAPAEGSGPALAATSDALWTRTSSEKTDQLAASDSDVTRLRVGLEGGYHVALEDGGSLAPKLELGARHDGGDAETGFGLELGAGLAWSDPALGLSLDVSARTLLAHENDALKDRGYAASLGFDPDPATERGPSFALRQEFGARATGGLDALFAPDPLEDRTGGEAASRWTMEAAYGVPAFGGRFTGSPHVGLGLSAAARDYTLGWRWTPEAASTPDLSFGFRAMRRESDSAAPEHTVGFEIRATW